MDIIDIWSLVFIKIYEFYNFRIADVFATVAEDAGYPAHVMNRETAITPDNDFKLQDRGCWIMHQEAFQVRK